MSSYISLFCGCGGFDYGFSHHFECLGAYDYEKTAVDTFKENLSDKVFLHDLSDINLPNLHEAKQAEILLAGSPCQGFSTVGLRKFDDPRNALIYKAAEIAGVVNPKVVICENVPAVKSGKHAAYWNNLISKFEGLGYHTEEFLYDLSKYGLAQTRKRLFLIAYKGERVDRAHLELEESGELNLGGVLDGVEGVSDHSVNGFVRDIDKEIASKIAPGQKLSNVRGGVNAVATWHIPQVYGHITDSEQELLEHIRALRRRYRVRKSGDADPVSSELLRKYHGESYKKDLISLISKGYVVEKGHELFDLKGTFNGKYRRLRLDKPSYTVDTNFGNPRYFIHPVEDRGFSVREAARIQGFPDSFVFKGGIAHQYRMVGNAVPPVISRKIASKISKVFFDQG